MRGSALVRAVGRRGGWDSRCGVRPVKQYPWSCPFSETRIRATRSVRVARNQARVMLPLGRPFRWVLEGDDNHYAGSLRGIQTLPGRSGDWIPEGARIARPSPDHPPPSTAAPAAASGPAGHVVCKCTGSGRIHPRDRGDPSRGSPVRSALDIRRLDRSARSMRDSWPAPALRGRARPSRASPCRGSFPGPAIDSCEPGAIDGPRPSRGR